jgi:hypothetical protein
MRPGRIISGFGGAEVTRLKSSKKLMIRSEPRHVGSYLLNGLLESTTDRPSAGAAQWHLILPQPQFGPQRSRCRSSSTFVLNRNPLV